MPNTTASRSPPVKGVPPSCSHGGATALDSLNLLRRPDRSPEARGKLVAVEKHAARGLDGRELSSRGAADATLSGACPGAAQRAVLLGAVAVLGEGAVGGGASEVGWERVGRAGGVRLRSVVDGGWRKWSVSDVYRQEMGGSDGKKADWHRGEK